jgi:hypothetical protein
MSFVTHALKQIVDLFHTEVSQYIIQIDTLTERIKTLEQENELLREVNTKQNKIESVEANTQLEPKKSRGKPKVAPKPQVTPTPQDTPKPQVTPTSQLDDSMYAKEAESFDEKPVTIVAIETEKTVTITLDDEKTRKEYQKEYQRSYRKLKKAEKSL